MIPQSVLPIRDNHTQISRSDINKADEGAVAFTDRILHPLDGQMEVEEPSGEEFAGWILAPVDDEKQQDEQVAAFDVDSSSKVSKNNNCFVLFSNQCVRHLVDG